MPSTYAFSMKIVAVSVIALLLAGILAAVLLPAMRVHSEDVPVTACHMNSILMAMRYYTQHVGPLPTNGTEAIFSALRGENPKNLTVLKVTDGQADRMLDPWRHPYRLRILDDGTFWVASGGPNGVWGDSDDIESRSEPPTRPHDSSGTGSLSGERSADRRPR